MPKPVKHSNIAEAFRPGRRKNVSSELRQGRLKVDYLQKVVRYINRKEWWHVPPRDPRAYEKRGKFLASSFREAEFYGRPCDVPERVVIAAPIIGDDHFIEAALIGRVESDPYMSVPKRFALDSKLRRAALRKGFDCIVLLTSKSFRALRQDGTIPRSIELNVLELGRLKHIAKAVPHPQRRRFVERPR
jgi:hypothetical protein